MRPYEWVIVGIAIFCVLVLLVGCAAPVRTTCSQFPCEWSKPVLKGKTGMPVFTDTAKAYLCLEPTRSYPVMPGVNCI